MTRSILCSILLLLTFTAHGQNPELRGKIEKFMAAGRASEVSPSENAYGQEMIGTLAELLLSDPAEAQRYFLKARMQVAAERAAGGTTKPGEGGERHRSVSVPGAAMGAALQQVEKEMKPGDARIPKILGAITAMLAVDEGCGMESNESVRFHTGVMMHKAGQAADGTFDVRTLVKLLQPEIKKEWLPVLLGAARHMTWGLMRDDARGHLWLGEQAANGESRELARMLLAAARISKMEEDAANKQRSGITDRSKLREEQLWLLEMMEQKSVPAAALAQYAAEILRQWPTAEPPLRYACALALAAAWEKDVPVNIIEARWILGSLRSLLKDGKAPEDKGFGESVKVLSQAWEKRLELNRTSLYGWPGGEISDSALAGLLFDLNRVLDPAAAEKLLAFTKTEAARDLSLLSTVRLSESLQLIQLYKEAAAIIAAITPEQLSRSEVDADRRMHVSIKQYHLPLNAAGASGREAAVKETIALLKDKNDDPAAWTGAAWSWSRWGQDREAAGNKEEALLYWCMSCALAHAADFFAHETHGKYQPPSEGKCRDTLKALNYSPDKVRVLRTAKGLETLLEAFDGAWKDMPGPVRQRLMDGIKAK